MGNESLRVVDGEWTFNEDLDDQTITFDCDKVIVKSDTVETQWFKGCALNFEKINNLVFSINGKKYTYKKIEL